MGKLGFLSFTDCFKEDVNQFEAFKTTVPENQPPHAHDYIQMWYVKKGEYTHYFCGEEYKLGKGNLFIVPPYFEHSVNTSTQQNFELVTVEFAEEFINDTPDSEEKRTLFDLAYLEPILITGHEIAPFLNFSGSSAETIETLLDELHDEYVRRDKFYTMLVKANIIKLLAIIAREYQLIATREQNDLFSKYRNAIQAALDYIGENYTEKIYLEDVCKIALMSPSSFSYIFKQVTGSTFTEYVQHLRISRARDLMVETSMPQMDICLACGFNDVVYFHRVFKKLNNISPGEYRRLHGANKER